MAKSRSRRHKPRRSSRRVSRSRRVGKKYGGNQGDESRSRKDYGKSRRRSRRRQSRRRSGRRRSKRRSRRRQSRRRSGGRSAAPKKVPWAGWAKICPQGKERDAMLEKCGHKCFLGTGTSFPVCAKGSCRVNKKGLWAAYVRAQQYGHKTIAGKAHRMLGNV
jgi:hypothetical protein